MRNRLGMILLSLLLITVHIGVAAAECRQDPRTLQVPTPGCPPRTAPDGGDPCPGEGVASAVENPALDRACLGEMEDEPELADGYIDEFNGGCNSPDAGFPAQLLGADLEGDLVFCGRSGWYFNLVGSRVYRDTDWFWTVIGDGGRVEWTLEADQEVFGFLLAPNDCDTFGITQTIEAGPDEPATMFITGDPGQAIWLWVGPRTSQVPQGVENRTFSYHCNFSGLMPEATPVVVTSWSHLKGMYR